MNAEIRSRLHDFYKEKGIHPFNFHCKFQSTCRSFAHLGQMTETKMSMVGQFYGEEYPKICVISLDPPAEANGAFKTKKQRTTEAIAEHSELEDFEKDRPGTHWAMTHIIVKDLLSLWGFQAQPGAVSVTESYSGRSIENMSAYFAHVNITKCSMNNPGRRQAPEAVHQLCAQAYLLEEIKVLEPDIVVTQGADTNRITGELFIGREISGADLPMREILHFGKTPLLWLPMHHPTQQLNKVRETWPAYLKFVKKDSPIKPIKK